MKALVPIALLLFATPHLRSQDDPPLVQLGDYHIEERGVFRRLIHKDDPWEWEVLRGTQIHRKFLVRADSVNALGVGNPWDVLLQEASLAAWDPTLEPLTYYHRTGPVGAVFHELRTRSGGQDAKLPIGVIGLECGTPAAYALNGQSITFFESSPNLKKLIVDTDRYFTFLSDARFRGATIDVRVGNARKLLAASKEQFAVLLVELFENEFDPGERLTIEAVKLYMSRVRENGIVALHISNKYFRLEPVVAAIARELGLSARVWNDDYESRPGKSFSAWVVLAREEKYLGILAESMAEQAKRFGTRNQLLIRMLRQHPPEFSARKALAQVADGKGLTIDEFALKFGHEAAAVKELLRKAAPQDISLADLADLLFGPMFHTLTPHPKVGIRKDGDKAWPRAVLMMPAWLERLLGPE